MSVEPYAGVYEQRNHAVALEFCDDQIKVTTFDGRMIFVPLAWFPWLEAATPEQQSDFKIWGSSIHWEQLDDGFSMQVVLLGRYGT